MTKKLSSGEGSTKEYCTKGHEFVRRYVWDWSALPWWLDLGKGRLFCTDCLAEKLEEIGIGKYVKGKNA